MGDNTHDTPDQIKPETIATNKAHEKDNASPAAAPKVAVTPTPETSDRPPARTE